MARPTYLQLQKRVRELALALSNANERIEHQAENASATEVWRGTAELRLQEIKKLRAELVFERTRCPALQPGDVILRGEGASQPRGFWSRLKGRLTG